MEKNQSSWANQSTPVPESVMIRKRTAPGASAGIDAKAFAMLMLIQPCIQPNTRTPSVEGTSSFCVLERTNSRTLRFSSE